MPQEGNGISLESYFIRQLLKVLPGLGKILFLQIAVGNGNMRVKSPVFFFYGKVDVKKISFKLGLFNTKEDYTIEYKDGELTVNGKKQPQAVADKYKKNFSKKSIAIKKQDGDININHQ